MTQDKTYSLRGPMIASVALAALLVGTLGTWGAKASLNSAIIASGVVEVDRELRLAQHLHGGAISEIHVAPGDRIEEGQLIASFDTLENEMQLGLHEAELVELLVRSARLMAERDNLDRLPSIDAAYAGHGFLVDALEGEVQRFEHNRAALQARVDLLQLRLDGVLEEARSLNMQEVTLSVQLMFADEMVERNRGLNAQGAVSDATLSESENERAVLAGRADVLVSQQRSNEIRQREMQSEIAEVVATASLEAQRQLRELQPRIGELRLLIERQRALIARSVLRAPVGGTVNELMVNTIGQVIAPGETVASIVPSDASLVVAFQVNPIDIDQIVVGQPARLRLTSFNQRTTPDLEGEVSYVAAASTLDPETGFPGFEASTTVSLPVVEGAEPLTLVPGMPVEVFIQTGARTPVEYLLQPVIDSMRRAMTEE